MTVALYVTFILCAEFGEKKKTNTVILAEKIIKLQISWTDEKNLFSSFLENRESDLNYTGSLTEAVGLHSEVTCLHPT